MTAALSDRLLDNISRTGMFEKLALSKIFSLAFLVISLLGARGRKDGELGYTGGLILLFFGVSIYFGSAILLLLDEDSIEIQDENLESTDPLNFTDTRPYKARLEKSKSSTGLKDAIRNASGTIHGRPLIVSSMEYSFIGGSMGAVVGEAITRAIERACKDRKPIIVEVHGRLCLLCLPAVRARRP